MTLFKMYAWNHYSNGETLTGDQKVTTPITFIEDVVKATKNTIVNFFKGIWHHWESVSILILASFGLDALLGEIPFWFSMPMWIEASMVTPVIATMLILFLVWNADRRARKREKIS